MGKPFIKEISELQSTFSWARNVPMTNVVHALKATWDIPLLSVGSGGSFSAAVYHADIHRGFFQSHATALTPLEVVNGIPKNGRASLWFMSAGGNNIDVRRAFKHAALLEPNAVTAIVGTTKSKLASTASKYEYTNCLEFHLPSGRDGFLATNSLIAFAVIIYRAYCEVRGVDECLPETLDELMSATVNNDSNMNSVASMADDLWDSRVLHVIYSPELKSVAVDLESKFVEAGLGSVLISDIRNFAHGRHHWFSKNQSDSAILALSTETYDSLTSRTLSLIDEEKIKKCHIRMNGMAARCALAGLVLSIVFTQRKGERRGIDPGRPGVPHYGSKIYRLTAPSGAINSLPAKTVAIMRKKKSDPFHTSNDKNWSNAYTKFIRKLKSAHIGGLVLDYDGTLVDSRRRARPPVEEIMYELNRLLSSGVRVAFATGRGKSIRSALQSPSGIKREYWDNVLIGYYNGSDIAPLSDNNAPNNSDDCCPALHEALRRLSKIPHFANFKGTITKRLKQITLEPNIPYSEGFLWQLATEALSVYGCREINVTRSSHSIDIIEHGVTKLTVVQRLCKELANIELEVLTIGDRGAWPGNDAELLSEPLSLSVDEVSGDVDSCWNLCPAGTRGPQGALEYLKRLQCVVGYAKYK